MPEGAEIGLASPAFVTDQTRRNRGETPVFRLALEKCHQGIGGEVARVAAADARDRHPHGVTIAIFQALESRAAHDENMARTVAEGKRKKINELSFFVDGQE